MRMPVSINPLAVTEESADRFLSAAISFASEASAADRVLVLEAVAKILDRRSLDLQRQPWQALAELATACRSSPRSWDWLYRMSLDYGLDPIGFAEAASDRVRDWYGPPVASLSTSPDDYELVEVDALPGFHNPHKCGNEELWSKYLSEEQDADTATHARRRWFHRRDAGAMSPPPATEPQRKRATDRLLSAIRSGEVPPCGLHRPETSMREAVDTAWRVLESARERGLRLGDRYVLEEVAGDKLVVELTRQQELAASLLRDPIGWIEGSDMVHSGQHRICQARAQGCKLLVVRTR